MQPILLVMVAGYLPPYTSVLFSVEIVEIFVTDVLDIVKIGIFAIR